MLGIPQKLNIEVGQKTMLDFISKSYEEFKILAFGGILVLEVLGYTLG